MAHSATGDVRIRRNTRAISPLVIFWLAAGIVANVPTDSTTISTSVGVLGLVHSVIGFVAHGGRRVSLPGTFLVGVALFAFFPAVFLAHTAAFGPLPLLHFAVNVCYFSQLIMYHFWWESTNSITTEPLKADPQVLQWGMQWGILLVLAALLIRVQFLRNGHLLIDAAAFSGATLFAVSAFRRRWAAMPLVYLAAASAFVAYYALIFDGFGRLTVGALAIAMAIALADRWRGRTVKFLIVAGSVPAVIFLSQSRGVGSVVSPIARFAQLLHMDRGGKLDHMNGESFWASAVALVPRELWPGKPIGFGAELTLLVRPDLAGTGHSEAALTHGEWLVNFGIAGLVAMVPTTAIVLRWFDHKMAAVQVVPLVHRRQLLWLTVLVLLAAGLVDLVWGGSFTYVSRTGTRIAIVLGLFVLSGWKARLGAPAVSG